MDALQFVAVDYRVGDTWRPVSDRALARDLVDAHYGVADGSETVRLTDKLRPGVVVVWTARTERYETQGVPPFYPLREWPDGDGDRCRRRFRFLRLNPENAYLTGEA